MIYTIPEFQNPTGATMNLERRKHLIELANKYNVLVVEDTAYRELRYVGEQLPTIKSLDTEGRVIHLGSFSKILAPAMRLGWALASPEILDKLSLLKLASDTQNSTLNMNATLEYLRRHSIDKHIEKIRPNYLRKRDLMLSTMREVFPNEVSFTEPEGGLFTWLTFPAGFDATVFMKETLLPEGKVAYVPGATFFPVDQEPNHARVNFSGVEDDQIVEGISRLGKLLKQTL
jgi:2-aminoadipate transaminase